MILMVVCVPAVVVRARPPASEVEGSGQGEPHLVRDHQPSSSGVDLKEGVHCGRGGYVRAQELSQGLKQKYSFTTSSWRCSAMLTSKCTYQLEFMCTKENRCPSPIESQLCAVENQSCPPFSSEPSALPIHQIAGIAHAGIQCRPSWTK